MAIKNITKQSWEAFFIAGSILNVQGAAETVLPGSSTVLAEDKDGTNVSATFLDQATIITDNDPDGSYTDNMLSMRVRAGSESASPYKVTFRMTTSEGNQWEVDMQVTVEET